MKNYQGDGPTDGLTKSLKTRGPDHIDVFFGDTGDHIEQILSFLWSIFFP